MTKRGLFIGMVTLDLVYLSAKLPANNEKLAATDYTVAAGGPATNAAVTFGYLGNHSTILGVVGQHPITQLIHTDIKQYGVTLTDLAPTYQEPPPVSSIIVTQATGDRAVISINAKKLQVSQLPEELNLDVDLVLIDGHQIAASSAIAQYAKSHHIPVAIDGGSWKPGLEKVLPFVDYAVCSANFYPPNCQTHEEVITYLSTIGIPHIAITHGEHPIHYLSRGVSGQLPVPQVNAIDTLGAGDIFHGAFCHYILEQDFSDALLSAANVAASSCEYFGTRQWMRSGNAEKG